MCTIFSIDRFFFNNNKQNSLKRIEQDAARNDDGWAAVFLGEHANQTVLMQSLELSSVLAAIDSVPWTRMFLHSRMSTTSTGGIFGCHNFSTIGSGLQSNVTNGYWVVQHNGILSDHRSRQYMVDSMFITQHIREHGPAETINYLLTKETYANVFMINPISGQYYVTRSVTNSLFTDGLGNFSTNPVGEIAKPVPQRSFTEHRHMFTRSQVSTRVKYPSDKEALLALDRDSQEQTDNLKAECQEWGTLVFDHIHSLGLFHQACVFLGYLGPKRTSMTHTDFLYLSSQQKKWAKTLGIDVSNPLPKAAKQ